MLSMPPSASPGKQTSGQNRRRHGGTARVQVTSRAAGPAGAARSAAYSVPLQPANHRPALCRQLRSWGLGSYGIAVPCALLMRRLSSAPPNASTQPGVGANPPLVRCPPA